jgi:DegV family protein with EDD domain
VNLTRENTAIVLDSTADFPDAQIRFPNMRVVPLYVRFGEESFRDYVELDPHDFYSRLKTAAELPTTSQPTPQDFLTVYHALAGYERIYSLHISARLSGTFQSASLAAADEGDRIRLIDTESASVGIGMLALAIQELLAEGTTDEEIEALIEQYREHSGILFTVDTLEFLAKGGRIGRAKALMGSLLNVKPILSIEDGEVVPLTRARGRAKAFEEFRKRFEEATTDSPGLAVGIAHAEAEDAVEQLRGIVLAARPQADIKLVTSLGAVVGTHAGPGTVGFFWFQPEG